MFEPKGTYQVIFTVGEDNNHIRRATGEIANYANGNIVLHNEKTGELMMAKYTNILQVFRIKE